MTGEHVKHEGEDVEAEEEIKEEQDVKVTDVQDEDNRYDSEVEK